MTPYLLVDSVPSLLEYLQKAFAAKVVNRATNEAGIVNHAQVKVGNSMVMMGQAQAEYPAMPTMLYVYVDNVDEAYQQALAAGGESLREPVDEDYGDRSGGVRDPLGNIWWLATPLPRS